MALSGRSALLVALPLSRVITRLCRFRRLGLRVGFINLRHFPPGHALQHAICMLDGIHMAVMILDHLDRGSHLLSKKINVYALLQAERGVGVPETIGRARNSLCTFAQISLCEEISNQGFIQALGGLQAMRIML